jgi:hypothetical protein
VGSTKRVGGLISELNVKRLWDVSELQPAFHESHFQHTPLDKSIAQIRLLHFSGSEVDGIDCTLETVDLATRPKYRCLSYTWGAPTTSSAHMIKVNGQKFAIRPNLYAFLKEYTGTGLATAPVWIDAISIDQTNSLERNHQVSLMAEIYSKAAQVIIWLGTEDAETEAVFRSLRALQVPRAMTRGNAFDTSFIWGITRLMNRAYWTRAWIVQELAFATDIVVRCGSREIHFDDFQDATEILQSRLADPRDAIYDTPGGHYSRSLFRRTQSPWASRLARALSTLRFGSRSGGAFHPTADLSTVITTLNDVRCTDPRDRIFALMSLASSLPGFANIELDYRRSVLDVYTDFIQYSVNSTKSLDILLRNWAPLPQTKWSGRGLDPNLQKTVPSWIAIQANLPYGDPAMDLRVRQNADTILGTTTRSNFQSSGSKPIDVVFGMSTATQGSTGSIFVRGIVVGTINVVGPRMAEGTISREGLDLLGGVFRHNSGAIKSLDDATWQVLCCNMQQTGERAPPLFRTALLSLLQAKPDVHNIDPGELLREEELELVGFEREFLEQVQAVCWNRRIVRVSATDGSGKEFVGLAPRSARPGDTLAILYGCSVPVLMRAHRDEQSATQWELLGEAYVNGLMNGEAVCARSTGDIEFEERIFEIR